MRFHFQPKTVHAHRLADAILAVNREAALDDMNDLAVVGDGDRLCGIQRPIDVFLVDHAARNADDPVTVDRRNLRASQADQRTVDFETRSAFRFFNGSADAFRGCTHVGCHAFADPLGRLNANPEDAQNVAVFHPGNQRADLARTDIHSNYNRLVHTHYSNR